ncbi:hypothetical protein WDZ16_13015 [Pseudokineococcus marinus]|uniref:Uncharacterized protein n=1 Tax=Pseudokineococcus marinus TaxID=351215 RepID=A0A849BQ31_9ACTN|nr:hypothetical protein [Pseudokineococcus marinus]NNH21656.1 hypothetical protein [Pseudokineococcus marinus]
MTGQALSVAQEALLLTHQPPAEAADADRWLLRVECGVQDPASWLSANDRRNRHAQNRLTQNWRAAAGWAVRGRLRSVRLQRAHIVAVLHHGDGQRRDTANYAPTVKAVVDGLVDGGLLPDDDRRHLEGPDLRVGSPTGWARHAVMDPPMAAVTLLVTDLGEALPGPPARRRRPR